MQNMQTWLIIQKMSKTGDDSIFVSWLESSRMDKVRYIIASFIFRAAPREYFFICYHNAQRHRVIEDLKK